MQKKCELITFGTVGAIRMKDGTRLRPKEEAKYLGCYLNNRADGTREVKKRISECMVILKKQDLFWGHTDCSVRKISVQKAVI